MHPTSTWRSSREHSGPSRPNLGMMFLRGLAVCVVSMACGCASYWSNRGRDVLDIFTATVETQTFGVKAQVGPWGPGVYCSSSGATGRGLIGGQWTEFEFLDCSFAPPWGFLHGFWGFDDDRRRKEFHVSSFFLLPYWHPHTDPRGYFGGFEEAGDWRRVAPRYTQLEVSAGVLAGGLRLGVNPGELVDFLAGWFLLDIYDDDVAADAKLDEIDESDSDQEPLGS